MEVISYKTYIMESGTGPSPLLGTPPGSYLTYEILSLFPETPHLVMGFWILSQGPHSQASKAYCATSFIAIFGGSTISSMSLGGHAPCLGIWRGGL